LQRFVDPDHDQHHVLAMRTRSSSPCGRSYRSVVRGFTLVELLIVLLILGVLSSLAVPSLQTMARNQALSNASSDLMSALLQARSMALKNNRKTIVEPVSGGDWKTGWRVYTDINDNNAFDSGTDTLLFTREALPIDIAIGALSGTGESQNSATAFAYSGDGFSANINGSNNGTVLLQSSTTTRKKYIVVSRVGRPRICDPKLTSGCEP
jgi:type IV fimbrial biogenesis protein FimT